MGAAGRAVLRGSRRIGSSTALEQERTLQLVAPEDGIASAFAAALAAAGLAVRTPSDAEAFLSALPPGSLDHSCLLIESELPGSSGVELVKALRERGERAPMIVLAHSSDRELRRQALAAGATDILDRALIDAYLLQRLAHLWPAASDLAKTDAAHVDHAGTRVTYRQMRPEDAEIEQEFVRGLSDTSRYMRFFSGLRELPPDVLKEFTNPRYPLSYALIATIDDAGRERQIGVARYAPTEDPHTAEFAVVVADEWQRRGIASQLMHVLTAAAAVAGVRVLEGLVLRENHGMLALCSKLGFLPSGSSGEPGAVRVAKELRPDEG